MTNLSVIEQKRQHYSLVSSQREKTNGSLLLTQAHYQQCCGHNLKARERGLNPEWIRVNCYSVNSTQASLLLGYQARSGGIVIQGSNGQYQFRPDLPWADKPGKKAAKYRTALGDEYDVILPNDPANKYFWLNLTNLKQKCYSIEGRPCILITEGGFKAIAACSHHIPTVAALGVEMGLTSSKLDPQGKRYLVPSLERFARNGFGFILAFDADSYTKKPVRCALIKLGCQLARFHAPVYCLPKWSEKEGKGIDDYIQMNGIEQFRSKLLSSSKDFQQWRQEYEKDAFNQKIKPSPPQSDVIGSEIASKYRNYWIYCDSLRTWLAYGIVTPGVWTTVSEDYLAAEIDCILEEKGIIGYGTNSYIKNIIGKLKRRLYTREWQEKLSSEHEVLPGAAFLPFRNGVLEIATGTLHQHSPGFRFTWQLPRDYDLAQQDWSKIEHWLDEVTCFNWQDKHTLLCFAAASLRGMNHLQKFLHLIGSGGSGKSTFTNLLTVLLGEENTINCNFADLEDKHEIARIFGKRLLILPDQDDAGRRMSNFKRLTGQDKISGRRLFENGFEFIFPGLVVVTSNFPLFKNNLGSWLTRRLIMMPFNYQCPRGKQRNLIAEFTCQLSAFTNYLLHIPVTEIETVLKNYGNGAINSTVWTSLLHSNGLAAWLNDWVIYEQQAITPIGKDKEEWFNQKPYKPKISTLYGSYYLYCRQTNHLPQSNQNFSAELIELCQKTLNWQIEKKRVRFAGKLRTVIQGLRLRQEVEDEKISTVEELLTNQKPKKENQAFKSNSLACFSSTTTTFTKSTTQVLNWDEVINQIDREMGRIKMSVATAKKYLKTTYGVESRLRLSDEQILEFLAHLKRL